MKKNFIVDSCPECDGMGEILGQKCHKCSGTGDVKVLRTKQNLESKTKKNKKKGWR